MFIQCVGILVLLKCFNLNHVEMLKMWTLRRKSKDLLFLIIFNEKRLFGIMGSMLKSSDVYLAVGKGRK